MKMTITDYKLMDGHSPKLGAVAFDVGKNAADDGSGSIDLITRKLLFVAEGKENEGISDYIGNDVEIFELNT